METLLNLFNFKGLLLAAIIFIPIEHLLPMHQGQKVLRRAWLNDLVYALLNSIVVAAGLTVIALLVATVSDWLLPKAFKAAVADQPYWLQFVALVILADLGFYLMHRLFHAVPALWRFHAVHHSIEEMDWLAAHRVHPIDQILTKGASFIPCFGLGFSEWPIIAYFMVYQWHSLMLHANINVSFGPLRWLVASPEFHHWHHTNRIEAYDKNFAGQIAFWDFLFGTGHLPKDARPGDYGVDETLPAGYLAQFVHPFRRPEDGTAENPDSAPPEPVPQNSPAREVRA
jgi:sterol desaturase/sphingolipid hydroxylase (fatty acid hydroxylase superfamily)